MSQVHVDFRVVHLWNVLDFSQLALGTPTLITHSSTALIQHITQQSLHIFLYLNW